MTESQLINAAFLLTTSLIPVTIGQLCKAAGLNPCLTKDRNGLKKALIERFKSRLKEKHGRFHLVKRTVKKIHTGPAFKLPENLFRGWVDPATGIVPPRLGLDPPKEIKEYGND